MTTSPRRQPKGVPAGGQFAPGARAEATDVHINQPAGPDPTQQRLTEAAVSLVEAERIAVAAALDAIQAEAARIAPDATHVAYAFEDGHARPAGLLRAHDADPDAGEPVVTDDRFESNVWTATRFLTVDNAPLWQDHAETDGTGAGVLDLASIRRNSP